MDLGIRFKAVIEHGGEDLHVVDDRVAIGEHGPQSISVESAEKGVPFLALARLLSFYVAKPESLFSNIKYKMAKTD